MAVLDRAKAGTPMPPMPELPTHRWITTPDELSALAAQLAAAEWIALDTESNSRFVYRERVCLTQFNLGGELILMDNLTLPVDPEALAPLRPALEDPAIPVYLHGGEYDVACLKRDYGIALGGVFDTQQAASLLGFSRTGYGSVVEAITGQVLPKEHSTYDWGQRPIDDDALRYALDDVRLLPTVVDALREQVTTADIAEEVAIANQAVMAVDAHSSGFDPAGIFRIKGVGKLGKDKLALLTAIHRWRDERAQEADLPPGRMLNNEAMLQIARSSPTNWSSLKRVRINGRVLREHGEDLIETIKAALEDPPQAPEPPARREVDPEETEREKRLKDWRRQEAARREAPLQLVLPARALEHLKRHPDADWSEVPQLGDKRAQRYGDQLRKLLKR